MRATDPERGIETQKGMCRCSCAPSMRATDPERGIETQALITGPWR